MKRERERVKNKACLPKPWQRQEEMDYSPADCAGEGKTRGGGVSDV
ncbi:MAG: hypothetical protein KJ711_04640 [Candidatus Omnitrophica bacterium]|nr:hypothetical protein [Candidatus Omnitrophota bacterium]